jgi:Ca2+-binding EF-hand superfamily protein
MVQRAFVMLSMIGPCISSQMLVAEEKAESQFSGQTPEMLLFMHLDKDGDGKLTSEEVPPERYRFFERLLRVAGKDRNGELTKSEFLEALKPDELKVVAPQNLGIGGVGYRPDPNQIFQRYDRNKDGKLSRDEVPEQAPPQFKQIFDRLQKQEVTREEFLQAFRAGAGGAGGLPFMRDPESFFKRLDSNQDGIVTLAEAPEEFRPQVERWLTNRLGKGKDDSMTLDDLKKIVAENIGTGGRPPGMPAEMMPAGAGRGGFAALLLSKLDTNGDGKLSKEELQKVGDIFDDLDRDHDGFLEPAELAGPPAGPGRPPVAARPETGTATTNAKEGNQAPTAAAKPAGAESAGAAAAARRKNGRPGGQPAQGQLRRFDTDGDGKISRDEAQGKLKESFDKIDTNGDGFLEPAEIRKALAAIGSK